MKIKILDKDFRHLFRTTTAVRLSEMLGVSPNTVGQHARRLGIISKNDNAEIFCSFNNNPEIVTGGLPEKE